MAFCERNKTKSLYAVSVSALAAMFFPLQVFAADAPQVPVVQALDQNGVNFATGTYDLPGLNVAIGAQGSGLQRVVVGSGYVPKAYNNSHRPPSDNFSSSMRIFSVRRSSSGGSVYAVVSYSGSVHNFYVGSFENYEQNQSFWGLPTREEGGSAVLSCSDLALHSVVGTCTLTLEDGTTVLYDRSLALPDPPVRGVPNADKVCAYGTVITRPDGEVITITYDSGPSLKSVTSSLGWMLKYHADANGYFDQIGTINTSVNYCDPAAAACTVGSNFPVVNSTTSAGVVSLTRNGVLEKSFTTTGYPDLPLSAGTANITWPSGRTFVLNKSAQSGTTSPVLWSMTVTTAGRTWSYSFTNNAESAGTENWMATTAIVTNPGSTTHSLKVGQNSKIVWVKDELNRQTNYAYSFSLMLSMTPPEGTSTGGYTAFTYDTANRVKTSTQKAKAGSGLADRVTSVDYVEGVTVPCVNPKTCNKILWSKDAKGNQTDYTYDATHGGVLTETGPANSAGVRPQTRYTYSQLYPKVLNSSGVLVTSTPVWRVTKVSSCRTATSANPASCVGTAEEVVTEYEYNNNNLLLTKTTVRAGNANPAAAYSESNLWQSTTNTWDDVGNLVAVDGPRTDVDDIAYTTYDVWRRKVLEIGADPDGTGALTRAVVWHKYDSDGREYRTEQGTCSAVGFVSGIPTGCSSYVLSSYTQRTYDATTGLEVKSITAKP